MRERLYLLLCFSLLFIGNSPLFAQAFNPYQHAYQGWDGDKVKKASPIRAFLNKFSLNVNGGYGRTFYKQIIKSDVLETPEDIIILNEYTVTGNTVSYTGIINWINAPTLTDGVADITPEGGNNILYADSTENRYSGSGFNIPLNLSLHLDIDRFRIGAGIMYEMHRIKQLYPKQQGTHPYIPNFGATTMFRYYMTFGAKFYHIKGWDYNVDFQIGKVKYGSQYEKSTLQNGMYFNLGFPLEYELSEYFFIVVRPSFDFKSYTTALANGSGTTLYEGTSFQFNQPAFYLNVGVRMKLPEIKRCPVKSCRTQLKHVHGSREFRGQPFYKEQNPKIGELYPELDQIKRKRKHKTNSN